MPFSFTLFCTFLSVPPTLLRSPDGKDLSKLTSERSGEDEDSVVGANMITTMDKSERTHLTVPKKSLDLARKDLQRILGRIEDLNLTTRALSLLRSYSRLRASKFQFRGKHLLIVVILSWVAYCYVRNCVLTSLHDRCLMELPSFTQKVFRPVEDCSMCSDVQQVEKVSNMDPVLFEERYAYSGRPVVITDATINWTATDVFSFSFFKSIYVGHEVDCQFFPYKTDFRSLQDVFNMSTSRALLKTGAKPWYIGWSTCDDKIGTILRQHYDRPYFLPITAESEKTDWIFMGSSGYGAPMHVDDVEHPSWQAQLTGQKLWILEPPRECYYKCQRLEITVNPGDIIVLDTNRWYHQTMVVSDDVSITIGAEYD